MVITVLQITPNGNIPVDINTSTLDEMTRGLPQGFYTTFNTLSQGMRVLGLQDHLDRLYVPARGLGLHPAVDERTLRRRIAQIVKENLPHESRARLILTKESGEIFVGVQPFIPLPETVYTNGVHVITSSIARHDARVKDTGFISESAAQRGMVKGGVFEILLTRGGRILEGMTSNFYAVRVPRDLSRAMRHECRGTPALITAQRGILLGVTRKVILRLARGEGMSIEYRAPRFAPREKFDEAFLTSSSRGVVPIVSIDNTSVGQGRVGKWTKMLSKAYQAYIEERSEKIVETL